MAYVSDLERMKSQCVDISSFENLPIACVTVSGFTKSQFVGIPKLSFFT